MTVYHFPRGGNAPINPRTSFAPMQAMAMPPAPVEPKPDTTRTGPRNEREALGALVTRTEHEERRSARRRYHYAPRKRRRDWDGVLIAVFIALILVALFAAGSWLQMRGGA